MEREVLHENFCCPFWLRVCVLELALAQVTSGTIFGRVQDPSGAMVKDATVTISSPDNGLTRAVSTSDTGELSRRVFCGYIHHHRGGTGLQESLSLRVFVLSAADKLNAGQLVLAIGATTDEVTVTADAVSSNCNPTPASAPT